MVQSTTEPSVFEETLCITHGAARCECDVLAERAERNECETCGAALLPSEARRCAECVAAVNRPEIPWNR